MENMKIKDPSLVVQVPVNEYNASEGKEGKVKDSNRNGVVDHEDTFAKGVEPQAALDQMCKNRAPADTGFAVTKKAQKMGVTVREMQNDSGTSFDAVTIPNSIFSYVPSYGGYVPELNGCGFNKGISIVDAGKNPNEAVFTMNEARGDGVKTTINTQTGEYKDEVPE